MPKVPLSCEAPTGKLTSKRRRVRRNHEQAGHFCDLLKRKKTNCTRVLLHNICGIGLIIGKISMETLKLEKMKKLVIDYDVDMV